MLRFLTYAMFFLIFTVIPASADTVSSDRNPTRLILPPALYVVPGQEINIYFDNIVLVQNINDYSFRVSCGFGRQDQERWRFTPKESDVGKFPLAIKVYDKSWKLKAGWLFRHMSMPAISMT